MYLFNYQLMDVGLFPFWAIMNNAATNISVQVFVDMLHFGGHNTEGCNLYLNTKREIIIHLFHSSLQGNTGEDISLLFCN